MVNSSRELSNVISLEGRKRMRRAKQIRKDLEWYVSQLEVEMDEDDWCILVNEILEEEEKE